MHLFRLQKTLGLDGAFRYQRKARLHLFPPFLLAYEIALTRQPNAQEKQLALDFLRDHALGDLTNVMLNLNEFLYER